MVNEHPVGGHHNFGISLTLRATLRKHYEVFKRYFYSEIAAE